MTYFLIGAFASIPRVEVWGASLLLNAVVIASGVSINEAPRSKLRGIKAELLRSQPAFALKSFGAVRHAIHPCSKLQGILAKAPMRK